MANDLTGDFDIVVQMPTQAMNRVFAAMHCGGRFPHSLSIRVDDKPPVALTALAKRPISARVDRFGDAIANWHLIKPAASSPTRAPSALMMFDAVVNGGVPTREVAALVHSHLEGIAQLQLSTPTMTIPHDSGVNVGGSVHMMARYLADPGTRDIPEFLRGDIHVTARIDQVTSQAGNVIDIDLKGDAVDVRFEPAWSSRALTPADMTAIEQAIRNTLKTAFQPSNAMLPPAVRHMQFKTFRSPPGGLDAIAVLLNTSDRGGEASSAARLFLAGDDHFAYAAGKDFVIGAFDRMFARALDELNLRTFVYSFDIVTRLAGYVITRTTIRYTVTLGSVRLELESGRMLLTMDGSARTPSVLPNFAFRMTQALTLQLSGAEAELASAGDVTLTVTTGGIAGWIVNLFKGSAVSAVRSIRDRAIARAQPSVRAMLNANTSLGAFLTSIMNPIGKQGGPALEHIAPTLEYTSFDITPDGIILHGALSIPASPPAQVDIAAIPGSGNAAHDYSALLSWIPGGTIREYAWRYDGQAQAFQTDSNRFVAINPPDAPKVSLLSLAYGYVPICVVLRGDRYSSSGAVVLEPVEATTCGWSAIPIFQQTRIPIDAGAPLIALVRAGRTNLVEVVAHAMPLVDETGSSVVNLVAHFAGENAAGELERIVQAVREAGMRDAATGVLAVVGREQLARTPYVEGVMYAEDERAWARAFGMEIARRPTTLLVAASGKVAWRREGQVSAADLAGALREHATRTTPPMPQVLRPRIRIGHAPPNFVFSYAPGRELTLRKLIGRPATLVFWKGTLTPSVETLRELQMQGNPDSASQRVVIAIHDGDPPGSAESLIARGKVWSVVDSDRAIALAYGVNAWPTSVLVDAAGLVRDVRYGRVTPALDRNRHQSRTSEAAR